jgi:hypothetical protein
MAFVSAFKKVVFSPVSVHIADASFNNFSYAAGRGIEIADLSAPAAASKIQANVFTEIAVPGLATLSSGQAAVAFSTLYLSSLGNTLFTTNPSTNTLTYEIRHPFFKTGSTRLPLNDTISTVSFVGSNIFLLSTSRVSGNYMIGVGVSSYTSTGFGTFFENVSTYNSMFQSTMASSLTTYANYSTAVQTDTPIFINSISSMYASTLLVKADAELSLSTFSTATVQFYTDIYTSVSSFSTSLSQRMEFTTTASTNSIFSQPFFVYPNQTTKDNAIYTLQQLSNSMSSQIMTVYPLFITNTQLTSTTLNLQSTLAGTSSYVLSAEGSYASTFSTQMTRMFSTPLYMNIWSTPAYTVYSSLQLAKGRNYDVLLSTCEFSLSSFAKYLTPVSRVFIEYSPCYTFSNLYTSNTSTNLYQISTFLTHNGYPVPNAAFTDYANPRDPYTKASRIEISTGYLAKYNSSSYVFQHFHSSIMYVDSSRVRMNVFNPLGGSVLPSRYMTDCGLNLTTTAQCMNYTSPTNALSIIIHNAASL